MQEFLEIFTLVSGVIYILLEIWQKNFMWVLGFLTSVASMFVFFRQGFYAFAVLQVYYVAVSAYGLIQWERDRRRLASVTAEKHPESPSRDGAESPVQDGMESSSRDGMESPVRDGTEPSGQDHCVNVPSAEAIHLNRIGKKVLIVSALLFVALTLPLPSLLEKTGDPMPWLDAVITVMGIVGTWWLSRSYIQQWWIWIVANALSVIMCSMQGMWWMSALYVFYTASAAYGLWNWHRKGVYIS